MAGTQRRFETPPLRANKEFEWLDPSYDDVFDQYINADLFGATDENPFAGSGSEVFSNHFERKHAASSRSQPNWSSPYLKEALLQPWSQDEYHAEPDAASPDFEPAMSSRHIYPLSRGRASLSASDITLSLESNDLGLQKAEPSHFGSTPSSPSSYSKTRSHLSSAVRRALRQQGRGAIEKPHWKNSPTTYQSPKMLSPANYRPRFPETWVERIERIADSFPLDNHDSPFSPRLASEFSRSSREQSISISGQSSSQRGSPSGPDHFVSPLSTTYSHAFQGQLTPVTSSNTDSSGSHRIPAQGSSNSSYESGSLNSFETPPQALAIPILPWAPGPTFDSKCVFPGATTFSTADGKADDSGPNWWELATPASRLHAPMLHESSSPINDTASGSLATPGLMIHCKPAVTSCIDGAPRRLLKRQQSSPAALRQVDSASFPVSPLSFDARSHYLPHGSIQMGARGRCTEVRSGTSLMVPSFTPRKQQSGTRSGSVSPPRHRRTPARPCGVGHQHRKSGSGSGHGHSKSSGGSGCGSADMWFVNFTPEDGSKILNGVAPSGSSKTKARREKEAAERRKKLSQAAVKLVQAAGGDIGALEKELLI